MDELTRLLASAASNLSGHPVRVRWRRPSRADARAVAFKSGGIALIDLHPGYIWDGDMLLYAIAHESGHIRDLYREWTDIPDLPSESVSFPEWALKLPVVEQTESVADKYALKWIEYAEQNYERYWKPGEDSFLAMLRALINWSE